jgi:membrane fusion protein, multidrug efflux system
MKKLILVLMVLAALTAGLLIAHRQFSGEIAREQDAEKPVASPSQVAQSSKGETSIRLDAAAQKRIGLETALLTPTNFRPELKVYGRVVDPAPLTTLVAEIAGAQVAMDASQREHQRVKQLYEAGQNAPARSVEAAEALLNKDRVVLESLREKLVLQWGREMAAQPDLPGLARSLASREQALVQVGLPGATGLQAPSAEIRLAPATDEQAFAQGTFFSWAATADPQTQSQGLIYAVRQSEPRLVPGTAVVGWIPMPGPPMAGVQVPRAAVVRAAGRAWVYVQTAEDTFARREVSLSHPMPHGWLATGGLAGGQRVVTTAAQMLLSEESKSQIRLMD